MKKKFSILFLLLSILLFSFIYVYTDTTLINKDGYFNYHISDFIGYIFLWAMTLLILNLLAFKLDINKYKVWILISAIVTFIAIGIAYDIGSGSSGILSVDGELMTWFFVGMYSFVSIIYFIFQFFKNRAKSI